MNVNVTMRSSDSKQVQLEWIIVELRQQVERVVKKLQGCFVLLEKSEFGVCPSNQVCQCGLRSDTEEQHVELAEMQGDCRERRGR